MNILVLNTGSSSLKFQIIDTDCEKIKAFEDKVIAKGIIERIGDNAEITFEAPGHPKKKYSKFLGDHKEAIQELINWITASDSNIDGIKSLKDIHAVGHRTVHGAEEFSSSVAVCPEMIAKIEECTELAPLHNPANLKGIWAINDTFGEQFPQVAVFDTAFHSTMPEEAYMYGLPYEYYDKYRVRRYGFHGTSHRYILLRYAMLAGIKQEDTDIITLHLGNGCSAAAIKGGKSIDTSMGMTPLEGLLMGTRTGDIDPSIIEFIAHKERKTLEEVYDILNKKSGVKGLSGISNDMRDIEAAIEKNDPRANLAMNVFTYRVKKYIGAYLAAMNGARAIIFTGGIGENGPHPRREICNALSYFGIKLNQELNDATIKGKEAMISTPDSKIEVWVIPTNEELIIARDTYQIIHSKCK